MAKVAAPVRVIEGDLDDASDTEVGDEDEDAEAPVESTLKSRILLTGVVIVLGGVVSRRFDRVACNRLEDPSCEVCEQVAGTWAG